MNNLCHICNSQTKFLLNKDGYSLFKCPSCDLVFMNPLPKQHFLGEKVYSFESGYQANKAEDLSQTVEDKKTRDILDYLVKNNIKGKLLDVGCSNGEFIYHAQKRGFEVRGVELNDRTADIAIKNGLKVYKGLLDDAHFENGFFDIIFLGDVIEHVLSPRDFINECKRILKPDGTIIISTPNLDCAWARTTLVFWKIFGIPWSSITPPHHTFQFSEKNLDMLLRKSNFEKIVTWFYKPPRLMYELGSLHLLKNYKKKKSIWNLFYMFFSYALYVLAYGCVVGTRFLRRNDFSMISIYKKNG